jgi:integrase
VKEYKFNPRRCGKPLRWRLDVQKNHSRKTFYSSFTGNAGKKDVERQAQEWLDQMTEKEAKTAAAAGERIVSEYWTDYMKEVRLRSGDSALDQTDKFGKNYLLPIYGDCKLSELTEGSLQHLLELAYNKGCLRPDYKPRNEREGQGLSKKSLVTLRAILRNFYQWGRMNGYTTLNPCDLYIPKGARPHRKVDILQPDNLKTLLSVDTTTLRGAIVPDEYIYAYRFAVVTGLRPGELTALRICDIDMKQKLVHVCGAINQYNNHTQGKNENAIRDVPMNQYAYEACASQMKLLEQQEKDGKTFVKEDAFFQVSSQKALYDRWRRYTAANRLPEISLYDMRHTFVSIAYELPDGELKQVVGHSKSMDTRGVYGHKVQGQSEKTANALTGIIDRAIGVERESK